MVIYSCTCACLKANVWKIIEDDNCDTHGKKENRQLKHEVYICIMAFVDITYNI